MKEMNNKKSVLRNLNMHDLIHLLKDELIEWWYLVVIDGIWKIETWEHIKYAFPKGKEGSKVLLTTQNKEVALHADLLSFSINCHF